MRFPYSRFSFAHFTCNLADGWDSWRKSGNKWEDLECHLEVGRYRNVIGFWYWTTSPHCKSSHCSSADTKGLKIFVAICNQVDWPSAPKNHQKVTISHWTRFKCTTITSPHPIKETQMGRACHQQSCDWVRRGKDGLLVYYQFNHSNALCFHNNFWGLLVSPHISSPTTLLDPLSNTLAVSPHILALEAQTNRLTT